MRLASPTLLVLLLAATACDDGGGDPIVGESCATPRAMFGVDDALAAGDPCAPVLDAVFGRVAQVGLASGTVWTRRTPHQTGIVVTAAHVASPCGAEDCEARARDPEQEIGQPAAIVARTDATRPGPGLTHALFPLFNPATPASELGEHIAQIRPLHDFSLFAIDAQQWDLADTHIAPIPEPIMKAPLPLRDPEALTFANPSHTTAAAGDAVLLVGYPSSMDGALAASVARVLSDTAAVDAIARLAAAGDEEGTIAYDPAVEMLVAGPEGSAGNGMSGGGLFTMDGVYLGVMVRASTAPGEQIIRVVRQPYILGQLASTLATLSPGARAEVAEFLEP